MIDTGIVIGALRWIVLVGWAIVTLWSLPSFRRGLTKTASTGDFKQVSLGVVGVALIIGQVNAIRGGIPRLVDYWTAVSLGLLSAAAVTVIVLVHIPKTPPEHQRALIIADLGILVCCILGGALG